jgi:hypothetical protein
MNAAELVEKAEKPAKRSAASELVELAGRLFHVGMSTDEAPYAVRQDGPRLAQDLRGTASSLRAKLARAYWLDRDPPVAL